MIEALNGNKEFADKVENEIADKFFEKTGQKGGKIQNISTDSNGVTKAQVCAVSGCAEIEFDLLMVTHKLH